MTATAERIADDAHLGVLIGKYVSAVKRSLAVHEAAHVVAAAALGGTPLRASIQGGAVDGQRVPAFASWRTAGNAIRARAIAALAGGVASGDCSDSDERIARREADRLIAAWRTEALGIVEQHRATIDRVAAALLEHGTLDEDALRGLLSPGEGVAR